MDVSETGDGTDFRPFFDMVIGILFVLLILVAAEIFFQQVQDQSTLNNSMRNDVILRRSQIFDFLNTLASRLSAQGLPPSVDFENRTLAIPLNNLMTMDRTGLPEIKQIPASSLGKILASLTTCVAQPYNSRLDCSAFDRLRLSNLDLEVRMGTPPHAATLSQDRFGALASTLLSATVLQGSPDLIAASTNAGTRVVTFDSTVTSLTPSNSEPVGDLTLRVAFD